MISPSIVHQGDPVVLRKKMVRDQLESRGITNQRVLQAMGKVPRHKFLPAAMIGHAYEDRPIPIGFGQTMSQPYTVARMLQLLEAGPGMRVLEIGLGSGYQAAVLAEMGCVVYGVEIVPQLYQLTKTRLAKMGLRNIHPHLGDGTLGFAMAAPFDRIIVAAGGPEIPPPLLGQLEDNGVMLIPAGSNHKAQNLYKVRARDGQYYAENMGPAEFVDLRGEHGW